MMYNSPSKSNLAASQQRSANAPNTRGGALDSAVDGRAGTSKRFRPPSSNFTVKRALRQAANPCLRGVDGVIAFQDPDPAVYAAALLDPTLSKLTECLNHGLIDPHLDHARIISRPSSRGAGVQRPSSRSAAPLPLPLQPSHLEAKKSPRTRRSGKYNALPPLPQPVRTTRASPNPYHGGGGGSSGCFGAVVDAEKAEVVADLTSALSAIAILRAEHAREVGALPPKALEVEGSSDGEGQDDDEGDDCDRWEGGDVDSPGALLWRVGGTIGAPLPPLPPLPAAVEANIAAAKDFTRYIDAEAGAVRAMHALSVRQRAKQASAVTVARKMLHVVERYLPSAGMAARLGNMRWGMWGCEEAVAGVRGVGGVGGGKPVADVIGRGGSQHPPPTTLPSPAPLLAVTVVGSNPSPSPPSPSPSPPSPSPSPPLSPRPDGHPPNGLSSVLTASPSPSPPPAPPLNKSGSPPTSPMVVGGGRGRGSSATASPSPNPYPPPPPPPRGVAPSTSRRHGVKLKPHHSAVGTVDLDAARQRSRKGENATLLRCPPKHRTTEGEGVVDAAALEAQRGGLLGVLGGGGGGMPPLAPASPHGGDPLASLSAPSPRTPAASPLSPFQPLTPSSPQAARSTHGGGGAPFGSHVGVAAPTHPPQSTPSRHAKGWGAGPGCDRIGVVVRAGDLGLVAPSLALAADPNLARCATATAPKLVGDQVDRMLLSLHVPVYTIRRLRDAVDTDAALLAALKHHRGELLVAVRRRWASAVVACLFARAIDAPLRNAIALSRDEECADHAARVLQRLFFPIVRRRSRQRIMRGFPDGHAARHALIEWIGRYRARRLAIATARLQRTCGLLLRSYAARFRLALRMYFNCILKIQRSWRKARARHRARLLLLEKRYDAEEKFVIAHVEASRLADTAHILTLKRLASHIYASLAARVSPLRAAPLPAVATKQAAHAIANKKHVSEKIQKAWLALPARRALIAAVHSRIRTPTAVADALAMIDNPTRNDLWSSLIEKVADLSSYEKLREVCVARGLFVPCVRTDPSVRQDLCVQMMFSWQALHKSKRHAAMMLRNAAEMEILEQFKLDLESRQCEQEALRRILVAQHTRAKDRLLREKRREFDIGTVGSPIPKSAVVAEAVCFGLLQTLDPLLATHAGIGASDAAQEQINAAYARYRDTLSLPRFRQYVVQCTEEGRDPSDTFRALPSEVDFEGHAANAAASAAEATLAALAAKGGVERAVENDVSLTIEAPVLKTEATSSAGASCAEDSMGALGPRSGSMVIAMSSTDGSAHGATLQPVLVRDSRHRSRRPSMF